MAQSAMDLVNKAKVIISEVTVERAMSMLNDTSIAIDVRELAEFESGHIADAYHLSRGVLEFKIATHPDLQDLKRSIIVYCKTGGRSALATLALQQLGYVNVVSLAGGFDAWLQHQQKMIQMQIQQ